MIIVDANPLVLALRSFKKRVGILVFNKGADADADDIAADATELDLQVQQLSGTVVYTDSFTSPPPAGTRIVRTGVGAYYILWGDPTASANVPAQTETVNSGRYFFVWSVVGPAGTEEEQRTQTVEVISPAVMNMIREFRGQIDKGIKDVSVEPTDFCPLGYTDGMLLEYLRGGMTYINAYQPYPTWCDLECFPECFVQVLYDAALVVGVNAQTLFAVDSDVEQWSDQGNAFVINHHPKLAAFTAAMTQRLDKIVPQMKLHFVRSGSVKVEMGPNFRLQSLVQMAPTGALFRNVFLRS